MRTGSGGWRLEQNANRGRVVARKLAESRESFRNHLTEELNWLANERRMAVEENPPALRDAPPASAARRRDAACLSAVGPSGLKRLLEGEAVAVRLGDVPVRDRDDVKAVFQSGNPGRNEPAGLEDQWLALVLGYIPSDAAGGYVMRTRVSADGFARSRVGFLQMKGQRRSPIVGPPFSLPAADPLDRSPRISIQLPSAAGRPPGYPVWLNLDYMMALTGRSAGKNIVADGYLRPPRQCQAGAEYKDYPLHQWLRRIAQTWNAEWRESSEAPGTLLVRARNWWMEDAADVPQVTVDRFKPAFGPKGDGGFEDLLALAELSAPQVHKVVESGLCPRAEGIVQKGWYDPVGARACLQFFNRLPVSLQSRAGSPAGLPLQEAPRDLVDTWLSPTLIAGAGAVTRERQDDAVFTISDSGTNPMAAGRWRIGLKSSGRFRTNWETFVQPPAL